MKARLRAVQQGVTAALADQLIVATIPGYGPVCAKNWGLPRG
jgi:hypothetical protein